MGGKLITKYFNLPEKRLSQEDFLKIDNLVTLKLIEKFPNHRIETIDYFLSKKSHGDLDKILENKGENVDYNNVFQGLFFYKPHKNGSVYSVPVAGFQVDISIIHTDKFDCALAYYGVEKGMMQGQVARSLGLLYGFDGLFLNIPLSYFDPGFQDHHFKEFLITRNPKEIFDILGFEYKLNFNNQEELYQWVASSRYFRPEKFLLENLTHQNRTRQKKRPIYNGFLEYIKNNNSVGKVIPSKDDFRNHIIQLYPHLQREIDKTRTELEIAQIRKGKFNGGIVSKLRNVTGANLGAFIKEFKQKITEQQDKNQKTFEYYLDNADSETILEDIKNFYYEN